MSNSSDVITPTFFLRFMFNVKNEVDQLTTIVKNTTTKVVFAKPSSKKQRLDTSSLTQGMIPKIIPKNEYEI